MSHTSGVLADFADFITQFKNFVCGSVSQSYLCTGNGTMTLLDPRPGILSEIWTVAATSATNFTVTGSVSGAQAAATVGTEYDNGFVRFLISAGGTAFIATDTFTLTALASPLASTLVKTSYTGTGNGVCTRLSGSNETITETWTLTATSATNFTVTGSVSGAQAAATVGTEYDNGFIRFRLRVGSTAFVATDEFVLDSTRLAAGGQTWEVLKDSDVRTDFQDVTAGYIGAGNITNETTGPFNRRVYFKSTGLAGTDDIYHCLSSLHSSTTYFNVQLRSMTAYNSSLTLGSQAGVSPRVYMILNNSAAANPYRFIANGRRAMMFVRLGTVYESGIMGWNFPNGSPTDYPMPYVCGASSYLYTSILSSQGNEHRAFFAPAGPTASGVNVQTATLNVLARNGSSWLAVGNYATASAAQGDPTTGVMPLRMLAGIGSVANAADTCKQGYCYGNTDRIPRPSSVFSKYAGFKGCYGDIDGVYYVSGEALSPEDNVLDPDEIEYICWPSTFYTHREAFAAIKIA